VAHGAGEHDGGADACGAAYDQRTELISTLYLLVMAGFDTTVNLTASGTLALLTHPGELARVTLQGRWPLRCI
jgi:cytochrome P450